jgi:hypothetical protein
MKITSLLIVLFVFQLTAHAQLLGGKNVKEKQQQIVSSEHVVSSVKASISEITGWVLKENTKWISEKNVIPNPDPKYILPDKVLGQDNLSEMEIREAQVNGKTFAVLVLKYFMPRYEFPTLKEGFTPAKVLDFYVFPAERIMQILPDTLSLGVPHAINLEVVVSGKIENFETKDIDFEVNTAIQRYAANRIINPTNLLIAVMPYSLDGKDHVKFKLIKTYPSEKLYQPYLMDDISNTLFNHSFYECQRSSFANFFNSASVLAMSDKPAEDQPTDFNGFFTHGVRAYDREDYYNAITDFTDAIRLMPSQKFYPVYAYRGNAKFKLGDLEGSLSDLNSAVALKPLDKQFLPVYAQVFLNRGTVRYYMKDMAGAREDWQRAAELNEPKSAEYLKMYFKKL